MPVRLNQASCGVEPSGTLLVILPGRAMQVGELEAHGFVQSVASLRLNVDVLRADAHSGYYRNDTLLERLRIDVIAPARAAGYTSFWLAGISLGGLAAVRYANSHPSDVDGLFLIAPYFGSARAAEAIAREGGLRHWRAPTVSPLGLTLETYAWRSLRALSLKDRDQPPIYLGYGIHDWNAPVVQVLAEALPASVSGDTTN